MAIQRLIGFEEEVAAQSRGLRSFDDVGSLFRMLTKHVGNEINYIERKVITKEEASTMVPEAEELTVEEIGSKVFVPGLDGCGWRVRLENGEPILHIGGIVARYFIAVKEFLLQQVRAHNGDLLVTDTGSGKVEDFVFLDGTNDEEFVGL